MARRAVQTLVAEFVRAGGDYRQAAVLPPADGAALGELRTAAGDTFAADRFVFACGPWLGRLFPALLGPRIFPTRQEVFFFAPEPGDTRFTPGRLPGWADFNNGDIYYGMPDLEGRGFKIAHDAHGPRMDPDTGDRTPSAEALADVRAYMARRFPALAGRPLSEARVCQYENSSNGDLLIDFHPRWDNVLLVGAGSGHGFKHGPAVGRYASERLLGTPARVEPRFSLASKGEVESRAVH
jgi:sarcosine oxidase